RRRGAPGRAMQLDVRVVEDRFEPAHPESSRQPWLDVGAQPIVDELMTVCAGGCVVARRDLRQERSIIVPRRDLERRSTAYPRAPFRLIEQPDITIEGRIARDEHRVAAVVHARRGKCVAIAPLADLEWASAEPPQEPLQSAGMEEGMRVIRGARSRDHREQRLEIASQLERTLGEVFHLAAGT